MIFVYIARTDTLLSYYGPEESVYELFPNRLEKENIYFFADLTTENY